MPRAHPFKFDRFALMQLLVEIVGHMPPQQGYFWIATADSASQVCEFLYAAKEVMYVESSELF